jgi:hypothetical protein
MDELSMYKQIRHSAENQVQLHTLDYEISFYYENKIELLAVIEDLNGNIIKIDSCDNNYSSFNELVIKILKNYK